MLIEILTIISRGKELSREEIHKELRRPKASPISKVKLAGAIEMLEEIGLIARKTRRPYFYEELTELGVRFLELAREEKPSKVMERIMAPSRNR